MNCAEFSDVLLELARNAELEESVRKRALAHADACPRCDEELVAARTLTSALRSLAASAASADAPAHVEENLLGEFRRRQAPIAIRAKPLNRWVVAGVAGLAAAALLSVGLLKPEIFHPQRSTSPSAATAADVSPQNSQTPTSAQVAPANPDTVASPASTGTASAESPDSETEYATDFVSLPSADDSAFTGDQMIVRVSLPPSALASFGLPVSSDGPDGHDANVLADFVLGEDGMPSAVRLVQAN